MIGLYIGSTTAGAGKTLLAFSLGILLQRAGFKVGVMKPLGAHPTRVDGRTGDADVMMVQEVMGLDANPELLSPVFAPDSLHGLRLLPKGGENLDRVRVAYAELSQGKDIMLVMGTGAFPCTGRACGLEGLALVRALGLKTLLVERCGAGKDPGTGYDSLLCLGDALGQDLVGVILNTVLENSLRDSAKVLTPYLEEQGLAVLGLVPREPKLTAIRVSELAQGLGGRILCGNASAGRTVETFLIGTMQVENFMAHLRPNCAVIAGGDRADLQLAALHANCPCMVLTGNISPSELIVAKAQELQVPVMVVQENTYAVARSMERILKSQKIRELGQIKSGIELIRTHVQTDRLIASLGL